MKTFLLIALTFTGIALSAPEAQARHYRDRSDCHDSYRSGYRSHRHTYYRGHYPRRSYYSSGYYRPSSRYYYRPSRSYYSSNRCYSDYGYRRPHVSFVFGF